MAVDAEFLDPGDACVLGWAGLSKKRPVVRALLSNPVWIAFRNTLPKADGLIIFNGSSFTYTSHEDAVFTNIPLPDDIKNLLAHILSISETWAGDMDQDGTHVFDPRSPSPGTHFRANLLVGDRTGLPDPLLTTPKAVVDQWGGGSSRFHADRQILATRWDLVPEENGFPANRQFYLTENGRRILYSAAPETDTKVRTRHGANVTEIAYETPDGLAVRRSIFMPSSDAEVSCGLDAQHIRIENRGSEERTLELVLTGMFGYPRPEALTVDVIYTCVTVEPRVLVDDSGKYLVVAPRYTPAWGSEDQSFHLSQSFDSSGTALGPSGYNLDYRGFIGNGTLEQPEHLLAVSAGIPKKGPAFFSVRHAFRIAPGDHAECHSLNGLLSRHEDGSVTEEKLVQRIQPIISRLSDPAWLNNALKQIVTTQNDYAKAVQVTTPDENLNRLINVHLPFQIRYQTYVSRSFGLTQKGYRRIGFREIQDLFAALPFEVSSGRIEHARDLIGVWASHVYRDGYANHQFYWEGHGPGTYSDDPLWLFQAVSRFIDLVGDTSILQASWPVADGDGERTLCDTLKAILHYCGRISVGRHGLPLIDFADWNDTLNLDGGGISGPDKMALYSDQIAAGTIKEGDPLDSDFSESVMNGFLLETARAHLVRFARLLGDTAAEQEWTHFGEELRTRLDDTWKEDFFARALINRKNGGNITYLGGQGDGMSGDTSLPGTYFLNSFAWAVLSNVANEEQIGIMLGRVRRALRTHVGLRLSSPVDFRALMPREGSGDYSYGDRENGGVFKHANMMAASAFIKAAREVTDPHLAESLADLAWDVLQLAAPFRTFDAPFKFAGNPRFCTQYTNPATGEHVGPLVSGTAPWMWLAWISSLGVSFSDGQVVIDPILPREWETCAIELRVPAGHYRIRIEKPRGFFRSVETPTKIMVDGKESGSTLPAFDDHDVHEVTVSFCR